MSTNTQSKVRLATTSTTIPTVDAIIGAFVVMLASRLVQTEKAPRLPARVDAAVSLSKMF